MVTLNHTNPRPSPIMVTLNHTNPGFRRPNPTLNGFFVSEPYLFTLKIKGGTATNSMETGLNDTIPI